MARESPPLDVRRSQHPSVANDVHRLGAARRAMRKVRDVCAHRATSGAAMRAEMNPVGRKMGSIEFRWLERRNGNDLK